MTRLVVAPGGTITSAWGNQTHDQTIISFTGTAQRGTDWPAPAEGAVSYLADSDSYWTWDGAAWVPTAVGAAGQWAATPNLTVAPAATQDATHPITVPVAGICVIQVGLVVRMNSHASIPGSCALTLFVDGGTRDGPHTIAWPTVPTAGQAVQTRVPLGAALSLTKGSHTLLYRMTNSSAGGGPTGTLTSYLTTVAVHKILMT